MDLYNVHEERFTNLDGCALRLVPVYARWWAPRGSTDVSFFCSRTEGINAVSAEETSDLKTATFEVESIQQWKANLLLDNIVYGTKSGEMLDPLKVENGRPRELGLMSTT